MILALALMAQAIPEPVAAPATEQDQEIVVTARKLSNRWAGVVEVRGEVATKENPAKCRTRRSTGDAEFDALGCDAMLACWPQAWPQIVAQTKIEIAAGRIKTKEDIERAQKTGKLREIYKDFNQCVWPKLRISIRDAIKRRKAQGV